MTGDITPLSVEQVRELLNRPRSRRIDSVHIHHTWSPTARDWQGLRTVQSIRRFHVEEKGWSDTGQHLTVGTDGSVWSGRHIDRAPASAVGANGSGDVGPLMIEIVGNFDAGYDTFGGQQAQSVYGVVATILRCCGLTPQEVRFHNEFNHSKSCPGTSLDLEEFRDQVQHALKQLPVMRARAAVIKQIVAAPARADAETDIRHEPTYGDDIDSSRLMGFRDSNFGDAERQVLQRHVINLEMGQLSQSGEAQSSPQQLDVLLSSLGEWVLADKGHRNVVLLAHGGLVSEATALRNIVLRDHSWWLDNGVYPIFIAWETGLLEVFTQRMPDSVVAGTRGLKDELIEKVLGRTVGRSAWTRMKTSAYLASQPLLENGEPGGAYQFAQRLAGAMRQFNDSSVGKASPLAMHMVGHSAGCILAAHFLPMFHALSAKGGAAQAVTSLHLLAPALRADEFHARLLPMISSGAIQSFSQFVMNQTTERDDNVAGIYGLSLLYMVRNACEKDKPLILGLEESLRVDAELMKVFDAQTSAELVLSPTDGVHAGRSASQARSHGAFDEDSATMNAVLRRVLSLADDDELVRPHVPMDGGVAAVAEVPSRTMIATGAGTVTSAIVMTARAEGGKPVPRPLVHALCIGIDEYRSEPLSGCVADAQLWAQTFRKQGAQVEVLLNGQATKQGVVDAWRRIAEKLQTGDTFIVQYAGHGSHVATDDPKESDGFDEFWVTFDYDRGQVLLDNEVGYLVDTLTPPGVQVVLFTDSCLSGSASRAKALTSGDVGGNTGGRARYLALEGDRTFVRKFRHARKLDADAPQRRSRKADALGDEIHFAACQDDQSAYEKNGHGDFTRTAVNILESAGLNAFSYADLFSQIDRRFATNRRQSPNFRALPHQQELTWPGRTGSRDGDASVDSDIATSAPSTVQDATVKRLGAIEKRLGAIEDLLASMA